MIRRLRRDGLTVIMLTCLMNPASLVAAQTPAATPVGGEWWTAWSMCDITPVQLGPTPENIPGMADNISWLEVETTNDSDIDMIV